MFGIILLLLDNWPLMLYFNELPMDQQSGCSSVGRAQASQAWGRGFEPRCPLHGEVAGRKAGSFCWNRLPDVPVNVKVGSARFFYCLLPRTTDLCQGGVKALFPAKSTATDRKALDDASVRLLTAIQGFAEPLVTDMGMELVEVQFRREGHGWVLRFFIDKEGGIAIDDCAAVSRQISAYLEVEDLISHAYHLEVSSPGLERPLKKRTDFTRYVDRLVRIKLREPLGEQRVLVGTLLGLEGDAVLLAQEGETIRIDMENIARARLTL